MVLEPMSDAERKAVRDLFEKTRATVRSQGLTGQKANDYFKSVFSANDGLSWFDDVGDNAFEVWDRTQRIASERKARGAFIGSIFTAPVPAKAATAPQAQAAPKAQFGNAYIDTAFAEIVGESGNGLMNNRRTDLDEIRGIVKNYLTENKAGFNDFISGEQKGRDAIYKDLLTQFESQSGPVKMAAGYAHDILARAVELANADELKKPKPAALTRDNYLAWADEHEKYTRSTSAYLVAKDAPPAGDAAAPAAGGDVPPAPAGDDAEPSKPYKAKTYGATGTPRGTVREAQLLLQAMGESTGKGNNNRFGAGQFEKSAMDGIPGPMTDAAIKKFQKDNKLEETGALDEPTMTKLREVAGPKLEAAKAAGGAGAEKDAPVDGAAADAPAPAKIAGTDAAIAALKATASKDQTDNSYTGWTTLDKIPAMFKEMLGVDMTQEQIGRITMDKDGKIHSADILALEKALNAVRGDAPAMTEDGNWDARLTAIAKTEGVSAFIGAVYNPTSVAEGGAPAATPGSKSAGPAKT